MSHGVHIPENCHRAHIWKGKAIMHSEEVHTCGSSVARAYASAISAKWKMQRISSAWKHTMPHALCPSPLSEVSSRPLILCFFTFPWPHSQMKNKNKKWHEVRTVSLSLQSPRNARNTGNGEVWCQDLLPTSMELGRRKLSLGVLWGTGWWDHLTSNIHCEMHFIISNITTVDTTVTWLRLPQG